MVRRLLVLTLMCASAGPALAEPAPAPATAPRRYVTIGADAIDAARAVVARHGEALATLETDGEVAIVALPAGDLEALAEQMHARHDRCGGFMVHDSLADARAAIAAAAAPVATPAYTLDRGDAVRAVLPTIGADRIARTIGELSSMKNRYYRSESGAAASAWLRDRWRSFTTRTDVTIELVDHGYPQRSVVLTIPGTTHPDEVVVIGGHLDSIAVGGTQSDAPGADDDASGIATLSEVLRALLASDYRPARTLKFMAYAAEEVGLRGSLAIARDFQRRGVQVVGVLQLDMTNYQGSDRDIWLMQDFTSDAQNRFLVQLIERYVGATWGADRCGYACSDHAAWHRAGFPASMPFEARMRQANRSIHTARDTLERSDHNAAHAVKFARLAAAYAIELAKGELGDRPPGTPAGDHDASSWAALALLAAAALVARRAARA